MLTPAQAELFKQLAEDIKEAVVEYWETYQRPVGRKQVFTQAQTRLSADERRLFQQYLTDNNYIFKQRQFQSASVYFFPPLADFGITEDMVYQALLEVRRTNIKSSNRARAERRDAEREDAEVL